MNVIHGMAASVAARAAATPAASARAVGAGRDTPGVGSRFANAKTTESTSAVMAATTGWYLSGAGSPIDRSAWP